MVYLPTNENSQILGYIQYRSGRKIIPESLMRELEATLPCFSRFKIEVHRKISNIWAVIILKVFPRSLRLSNFDCVAKCLLSRNSRVAALPRGQSNGLHENVEIRLT